ncbi:MAG: sensor histidine kinase [Actinobacteria bacterium]|nr:sensor histidine kinase [Actinomycetota bacterium]MBU4489926.1 sensor histidine kinase [Actinomycetota bacterium]
MRFSRSLKGRLTIIVALAVVVTGTVVLLFAYYMARSLSREQVFESMESAVSNAANAVEANVAGLLFKSELLAFSDPLANDLNAFLAGTGAPDQLLESMSNQLYDTCRADPSYNDISVALPDGTVIAGYGREGKEQPDRIPDQLLESALSSGTGMDYDLKDGDLVLTVASAVGGPDGEVIGVSMITSRATELQRELSVIPGLGSSGAIMLSKVRGDRVLVLIWPVGAQEGSGGWKVVSLGLEDDTPMVKSAIGEKGEGVTDSLDGEKVVVSYDIMPVMDWGVTVTMDSAEAFAPISRLRNVIIIVVVVLFFGGLALAYMIARSIARPLEELQHGVKALAGGQLTTRVTISHGIEVTALAEEFNQMAIRLNDLYQNLERKAEERTVELREANRRLQELHDLKSEFVSVASHELRSPLASMKMGVATVVNEMVGPLNEEQKVMLTIANKNIDRLTKLTSELLELAKIEAGQLDLEIGKCDLVELAREVVEAHDPQAKHLGLQLEVVAPEAPAYARCDRDRMYQVIQNLIGNALKFTEEGGVTVSISRRNGYVVVCVKDTGPGLPDGAIDTLFEKFPTAYTETRSEKRGTGLGLAICKGIVEAHGAEITVESEPGEGSRFCFTVPVWERDARE